MTPKGSTLEDKKGAGKAKSNGGFLHETPLLDRLETGPWPSFVTGFKELANRTRNTMLRGVLDQLEYSYETKTGYWKGGTVGVRGYGAGIIARFSIISDKFPEAAEFHTLRVQPAPGLHYTSKSLRDMCDVWEKHGSGVVALHGQSGDIMLQGITQAKAQECFDELNRLGWDLGGAGPTLRTSASCVGPARCEQACYDTLGVHHKLLTHFVDLTHRPSLPYKFKFKFSGCPNDCTNSIMRSDVAVIGTWRGDIEIDQAEVGKYVDQLGADYIQNSVVAMCPTKAIRLKGCEIEIDNRDCVRCMHCINALTKALSPGGDRGVTILVGGKGHLKVGNMLGSMIVPFMKLETDEDLEKLVDFGTRMIEWWADNALDHERIGETIERVGMQSFLDGMGIEPTIDMVEAPRDNPFFKAEY